MLKIITACVLLPAFLACGLAVMALPISDSLCFDNVPFSQNPSHLSTFNGIPNSVETSSFTLSDDFSDYTSASTEPKCKAIPSCKHCCINLNTAAINICCELCRCSNCDTTAVDKSCELFDDGCCDTAFYESNKYGYGEKRGCNDEYQLNSKYDNHFNVVDCSIGYGSEFVDCSELKEEISQFSEVTECEALAYGHYAVIAVRTRGIVLNTQQKRLAELIEELALTSMPNLKRVVVLTSVRDFFALRGIVERLNSGADPDEIYRILKELLGH